jgi:hypothetical protein
LGVSRKRTNLLILIIALTAGLIFVGSYQTDSTNYTSVNTELPSPGPAPTNSPTSASIPVLVPSSVLVAVLVGAGIVTVSIFVIRSRK